MAAEVGPTPEGLRLRYPGACSGVSDERAAAALEDAAAYIDGEIARRGAKGPGERERASVAYACAARALQAGSAAAGGTAQLTQTAGPYSETVSYASPGNYLFLTKEERRRLGIAGSRAAFAMARTGLDDDLG